ncbi:hypothetical protein DC31_07600 [Microbacterium sp. CH12i]|nr:hypothetical protein DC31_07600 [Microbacterium sp. CH12i]
MDAVVVIVLLSQERRCCARPLVRSIRPIVRRRVSSKVTGMSREEPNGRSRDMNTVVVALLADHLPLEATHS